MVTHSLVHLGMATVATYGMMTITPGAIGHPTCEVFPNGDFDGGGAGWTHEPIQSTSGDGFTQADAWIVDASDYGGPRADLPFDEQSLQLIVSAAAGLTLQGGSADATSSFTTQTNVDGPFLRFARGGGFEFQFFGLGSKSIEAKVTVSAKDGDTATSVIYDSSSDPSQPECGFGLAVLGTFDGFPPVHYLNLVDSGIGIGENVTIAVTLRATAEAITDCQETISSAVLLVDDLSFCDRAPIVGDLNGDGVVDGIDLGILLANWSIPAGSLGCGGDFPCLPDLNQDGRVDGLDLGILLANWTLAP